MRFQLCSDIHTEFHDDKGIEWAQLYPVLSPTLVVAGDLGVGDGIVEPLRILADRFEHVVFVAGNHEHYGVGFDPIDQLRSELSIPNLHWLECSEVTIEGQRFVGATLWWGPNKDWKLHRRKLNDFRTIPKYEEEVLDRNQSSRRYLYQNVRAGDVVVTHHLPSWSVVPPNYVMDRTSIFYVSPMDSMFGNKDSPAVWVCGHSHQSIAKTLGDTLVCRNPHGYVGYDAGQTGHDPTMLIDLTDGVGSVCKNP